MRVFTTRFLRTAALGLLLGTAGAGQARADEALRHIQQSLRDQGFYYGPIDGSPGDETTQALRRYQIRNGLAVTGQLNEETRRSIDRTGASTSRSGNTADSSTPPPLSTPKPATIRRTPPAVDDTPVPAPTPAYRPPPARPPRDPDDGEDAAPPRRGPGNIRPDLRVSPDAPPAAGGGDGNGVPREGIPPSATLSAVFASTPYEFAPPPVQADILRRAQAFLGRNGFYDGRVDGVPGPAMTDALINYQEVSHLRRTGRLDVSTLGTMRLMPGRQTVGPRRGGPDIIFPGRIVD